MGSYVALDRQSLADLYSSLCTDRRPRTTWFRNGLSNESLGLECLA
jgi:hypothetical protein